MKINLQTLNFKADEKLKDFVNEKVGKLERFDGSIISAEVTLTDSGNSADNKHCDIQLVVPGNDNFVKKSGASFEEAIAEAVDTLRVILSARKEKFVK